MCIYIHIYIYMYMYVYSLMLDYIKCMYIWGLGFGDIIPATENQIEKNMNNEMDMGNLTWFIVSSLSDLYCFLLAT